MINVLDPCIDEENNKNLLDIDQLVFRHCDIYDKNKEKHITPKWLNLPLEKIKYIIKGLIDTDGCKGTELLFDTI